ncbi:hypothetical protein niasHT_029902 [Heterodera trifolii]|uniref:Uncharacterized protein n=1 Tax=Heterodera trifolii TaxID=157864 RepID=A0ABD2KB61_9BILA
MKRRGDRPQHAHTLIRQISSRKRAQQHHCPTPNTNQSSANNFIYHRRCRHHHHDDKHSSSSHRCAIWPTTLTPSPSPISHHWPSFHRPARSAKFHFFDHSSNRSYLISL